MEALIAAAYLDSGMESAKGIVTRLVLPMLRELMRVRDFKTELQELVQQKRDQVLRYELLGESGPDHCKEFLTRVLLNGIEIGRGSGRSKKRAEQAAAERALEYLQA
jgi:ribonuclease-3